MLPPPPATPRTLIVKIEPTSRAFLVGGTFSRKHHITRILCCIPNRECPMPRAPTETPRAAQPASPSESLPACSERSDPQTRPSSYTSRAQ